MTGPRSGELAGPHSHPAMPTTLASIAICPIHTSAEESPTGFQAVRPSVRLMASSKVTANVTPFVPKAHTPFQWMAVTPQEIVQGRLRTLQKRLKQQGIAVKSESPRWSAIQAILSRGDRRLGTVLTLLGGDSPKHWHRALAEAGLQSDDLLGARGIDEPLPWEFIDTGVSVAYLRRERERAQTQNLTPACPSSECRQCGVCSGD